jgi:hypothetical protein
VKVSPQATESADGKGLKDFEIRMSNGTDLKFIELTENGFFVDFPAWGYAVLV